MKRYQPYLNILLFALLLRIIWALAVPVVPISDSHAYDVFAQNLASGNVYGWKSGEPTAYWPPGTSLIYSLFYRLFGHTYLPIVIFKLFLGVLLIGLSMYLANLWFDRITAVLTGLILTFWPVQIEFTTILASELIFNVLVLMALAIWLSESINLQVRAIITGITLAGAAYVRTLALLIPILLAFFRLIKIGQVKKTLIATLVVFALMGVLIAPWSIRNMRVFGQFVMISTNGGTNLWMGNNPASKGHYMQLPAQAKEMNEAKRNDYLKSLAVEHIKDKPLLFLKRCFTRLIDTHSRESIGVTWNEAGLTQRYGQGILLPIKLINQFYWLTVLGLALIGIFLLGKQYGILTMITHPTVVFWSYYAVIHIIIVAQDRYHFPSIPMIAILAAFTLNFWLKRKHVPRLL